jgi:hypothetical protein
MVTGSLRAAGPVSGGPAGSRRSPALPAPGPGAGGFWPDSVRVSLCPERTVSGRKGPRAAPSTKTAAHGSELGNRPFADEARRHLSSSSGVASAGGQAVRDRRMSPDDPMRHRVRLRVGTRPVAPSTGGGRPPARPASPWPAAQDRHRSATSPSPAASPRSG